MLALAALVRGARPPTTRLANYPRLATHHCDSNPRGVEAEMGNEKIKKMIPVALKVC